MKTDRWMYVIAVILLFVLSLGAAACGSGELQIYVMGDEVDVGFDQHWTLSSVDFLDDRLEAGFTIENVGTEDSSYNLVLSLQARDPVGDPLSQVIPCGSNLDGSLQPGDTATGTICWDTRGSDTLRIHYFVLLSETDIVWEVER
ncbi:MAG TPA: hypothetical protein G4O08_03140 [Anaerolineae bacterium]|nr:hypothetical protein [Anaerolineae bacterium]